MAKEKTNPRLTVEDIVELIAKKSTLTKSQVKHANNIALWRIHSFCKTHRRGWHNFMINLKTI